MSHTRFRVNLFTLVAWLSRNSLLEMRNTFSLSDCSEIQTHNHLVYKWTLNHIAKLLNIKY